MREIEKTVQRRRSRTREILYFLCISYFSGNNIRKRSILLSLHQPISIFFLLMELLFYSERVNLSDCISKSKLPKSLSPIPIHPSNASEHFYSNFIHLNCPRPFLYLCMYINLSQYTLYKDVGRLCTEKVWKKLSPFFISQTFLF